MSTKCLLAYTAATRSSPLSSPAQARECGQNSLGGIHTDTLALLNKNHHPDCISGLHRIFSRNRIHLYHARHPAYSRRNLRFSQLQNPFYRLSTCVSHRGKNRLVADALIYRCNDDGNMANCPRLFHNIRNLCTSPILIFAHSFPLRQLPEKSDKTAAELQRFRGF